MRRKSEKGFALLLELVIAMAVMAVLMAGTTVAAFRIIAARNQQDAQVHMRAVQQAEFTVAYCAIPANACNAGPMAASLPVPGVFSMSGYTYTFVRVDVNAWTYQAVPTVPGFSGTGSFYIDSTGIMRCNFEGVATAGSLICQ